MERGASNHGKKSPDSEIFFDETAAQPEMDPRRVAAYINENRAPQISRRREQFGQVVDEAIRRTLQWIIQPEYENREAK
jgi:hypothetical protein